MNLSGHGGEPSASARAAARARGWEILDLVARRETGVLYAGRHARLGIHVAVRVLPRVVEGSVERGAHIGPRQGHPNLVETLDVLEGADGETVIVTEWLDGRALASRLLDGPCPLDEALRIFGGVCAGLAAAHQDGILHGRIEPARVFLTLAPHGLTPKLLGFGIAPLDARRPRYAEPAYASPESAVSPARMGVWSDVHAMGLMLHEMLSGIQPARFIPGDLPPSPRIGSPLLSVLRRATALAPELRQGSIAALFAEVRSACDGTPGSSVGAEELAP